MKKQSQIKKAPLNVEGSGVKLYPSEYAPLHKYNITYLKNTYFTLFDIVCE